MTNEDAIVESTETDRAVVLGQVALVVDGASVDDTARWYETAFGLIASGGSNDAGGAHADHLQRLSEPDPALAVRWLLDQDELFQFEIFSYERPRSEPKPSTWSARDIGYASVTIWVADFDLAVDRIVGMRAPISTIRGERGKRRTTTSDPNGTIVELLEEDIVVPGSGRVVRPEIGAAVRSVRLSVPNLERSVDIFRDCYGLTEVGSFVVHQPSDEALWGLDGETPTIRTFAAGNSFFELAEYRDPAGLPRPAAYRLSDAGIMNIALVTRSKAAYELIRNRAAEWEFEVREFIPGDHSACAYVWDDQGFCTELLFVAPTEFADRALGYVPVAVSK